MITSTPPISPEFIQAQLQRRAAQRELRRVADGAGVSVRTLNRIMKGASFTTANGTLLQKYLTDTQHMKSLPYAGK
jgi:DNA-binding phage protein